MKSKYRRPTWIEALTMSLKLWLKILFVVLILKIVCYLIWGAW